MIGDVEEQSKPMLHSQVVTEDMMVRERNEEMQVSMKVGLLLGYLLLLIFF